MWYQLGDGAGSGPGLWITVCNTDSGISPPRVRRSRSRLRGAAERWRDCCVFVAAARFTHHTCGPPRTPAVTWRVWTVKVCFVRARCSGGGSVRLQQARLPPVRLGPSRRNSCLNTLSERGCVSAKPGLSQSAAAACLHCAACLLPTLDADWTKGGGKSGFMLRSGAAEKNARVDFCRWKTALTCTSVWRSVIMLQNTS